MKKNRPDTPTDANYDIIHAKSPLKARHAIPVVSNKSIYKQIYTTGSYVLKDRQAKANPVVVNGF